MLDEQNDQDVFEYARTHVLRQLDDLRDQMAGKYALKKEKKMAKKNKNNQDVAQPKQVEQEDTALDVLEKGSPVDATKEQVRNINSKLTQEGWRSVWEKNGGLNNEGVMVYTHKEYPGETIIVSKKGGYVVRK